MLSFLNRFQHRAEMRESKDEILIGELVLAMAQLGNHPIRFHAHDDRQAVVFKPVSDPVLHTIAVILDRKTGDSVMQQALIGSKATLRFQAEVKNYLADPDDLIQMYKTDLQNVFKMPILGNVRMDHQLNSVLATRMHMVDIDKYILAEGSRERLHELINQTIEELREKLVQYKK